MGLLKSTINGTFKIHLSLSQPTISLSTPTISLSVYKSLHIRCIFNASNIVQLQRTAFRTTTATIVFLLEHLG